MALTAASNAFSKKKMPKTAGQKQPSKNSGPRTAPAGFGGKPWQPLLDLRQASYRLPQKGSASGSLPGLAAPAY